MPSLSANGTGAAGPGESGGLASLSPVAPGERIHGLDLLRGWAMFGVLWSNLNDWYGPRDPGNGLDRGFLWLQENVVESRFYTLLCLLFGVGFGIQLFRATERGVDVRTLYYRRSAALLLMGVIHGTLIWSGDILTIYALVAFALVMFRTASPRRIVVAAALCWFVVPEIVNRIYYVAGLRQLVGTIFVGATGWTLQHGSWRQIAPLRITLYLDGLGRWGLLLFYSSILAMFLTGLWAVRSGYLRRVIDDRKTTRRLLVIALTAAAVGYAWPVLAEKLVPRGFFSLGNGPSDPHFWIPTRIVARLFDWATAGTAVAFAAILLLLWQRPGIARLLRPLAATGRMALSTYLVQSVVCTLLFYGYGLGWYGDRSYTEMFIITIVLFTLQMAASTWWLSRYRFGPAEWLWRRLTYGQAPRMRLAAEPAVAPAPASP